VSSHFYLLKKGKKGGGPPGGLAARNWFRSQGLFSFAGLAHKTNTALSVVFETKVK